MLAVNIWSIKNNQCFYACLKIGELTELLIAMMFDVVSSRFSFLRRSIACTAMNPAVVRVSVSAVTIAARLFGKRTSCVTTRVRVLLAEHTYSRGSLGFAGNLLPPCAIQRQSSLLFLFLACARGRLQNARSANFAQSAHVPTRNCRTTRQAGDVLS